MATLPEFPFFLYTSQGTLLDGVSVTMAIVPGVEGDLGVMAKHTPLVTALKQGILRIFRNQEMVFSMPLSGQGILHIEDDKTTLLLEQFCPLTSENFSYTGMKCMPTTLRIDSKELGVYKIDSEVLELLTPSLAQKLAAYVAHHANAVITIDLAKGLDKQKAA